MTLIAVPILTIGGLLFAGTVVLLREEQRLKRDRLAWESRALGVVAARLRPAPVVSERVRSAAPPSLPARVATLAAYGVPKVPAAVAAPPPIKAVYTDHLPHLDGWRSRGRRAHKVLVARARDWSPKPLGDEPVDTLYVGRSVLADLVRTGFDDRAAA